MEQRAAGKGDGTRKTIAASEEGTAKAASAPRVQESSSKRPAKAKGSLLEEGNRANQAGKETDPGRRKTSLEKRTPDDPAGKSRKSSELPEDEGPSGEKQELHVKAKAAASLEEAESLVVKEAPCGREEGEAAPRGRKAAQKKGQKWDRAGKSSELPEDEGPSGEKQELHVKAKAAASLEEAESLVVKEAPCGREEGEAAPRGRKAAQKKGQKWDGAGKQPQSDLRTGSSEELHASAGEKQELHVKAKAAASLEEAESLVVKEAPCGREEGEAAPRGRKAAQKKGQKWDRAGKSSELPEDEGPSGEKQELHVKAKAAASLEEAESLVVKEAPCGREEGEAAPRGRKAAQKKGQKWDRAGKSSELPEDEGSLVGEVEPCQGEGQSLWRRRRAL
uniref:Uncharacterized protein n=1 Tax=Sphaerodactylus townsendi TaxID=933632 RepID=A0ACB8GCS6_9SAUR